MSTLKDVQNLANELINKTFTIETYSGNKQISAKQLGYTFKFDSAKRRFGCCNYSRKTISLSKHMCEVNLHQIEGKIKDTILHELAHAFSFHLYGFEGKGHGYKWQNVARQIGSDAKRCFSYSDFGGLNKPQSKYSHVCPTCGNETPVHRKPKRTYACGKCCTNGYDARHKLILKQNY